MEQDLFHEPYRLDLIPQSKEIKIAAKKQVHMELVLVVQVLPYSRLVEKGTEEDIHLEVKRTIP